MKSSIKKFAFIVLVSVFLSSHAFAQNKIETTKRVQETDEKLKPVEEYADSVGKFVEKEKSPHLVFADFSDYNENSKPLWKKFNSEAEFEKYRENNESYTIAYVWQKNGKTVAANITFSSPSGDWAQFVLYIFRENGTIAKIDSTLNTFYGDATVLRNFFYDEKGNLLKETSKFQDLQSEEIFDPKERDFYDREVEVFKNVSNLPFAKLLKTSVKKKK